MRGAFAHGMYSAGCLATAVTDAVGIESLARFAVRFRAQARLGAILTSKIVVSQRLSTDDGVTVELACEMLDEQAAVIVTGSVVLKPSGSLPCSDEPAVSTPVAGAELIGRRLAPAVVAVERGPVQVFATAVGDDNPIYRSAQAAATAGLNGIPVPPTFVFASAYWGIFADAQPTPGDGAATLVELIALLRNRRKGVVLHGEQEFAYHRPMRVGDVLHVEGFVEDVHKKPGDDSRPGMTLMVVRTDYRDAAAQLVTTARSTFLFRPATR
ncbi:MAG TPA: MaoC family dehydratase N-terminal domain-containing protein, partial [Mycobacterium sp.]|nr:MaoC family dehydratase N-terminal domain-containing protein [Mycobacterium sp.]